MRLFTLFGLSALLHGYIAMRLLPSLAGFPGVQLVLVAVLALSTLLTPLGLAGRRLAGPALADPLRWAGLLCMGLFSSLLVLTLARDALLAALWLVLVLAPDVLGLAHWRTASAQGVPLLAAFVTLLGFLNAR